MRRCMLRPFAGLVARAPFPLLPARRHGSDRHKVLTAEDAVHLIEDGATITVGGFVAQGCPEHLLQALARRFKETGSPKGLTLVFGGGPGDSAVRGLNHLALPGLLRRTIGAHYGQTPRLAELVRENAVEAYNLPLGAISRLFRCTAAGQPCHITSVGLGTFVDPVHGGGKLNDMTTEDLVTYVELYGHTYLAFKALPIDCALIRGTTADSDGNLTMERESLYCDARMQAMAARATRGVVIAQAERVAAAGSLHPRHVHVPGTTVDAVVVSPPEDHHMSFFTAGHPGATAEIRAPPALTALPLHLRKVVGRRGAMELLANQVANLGIGMPEGVASVAEEEGILQYIELTTEAGVHGGVGLTGHDFGPAVNYDALLPMHEQFDFYNGGGLDVCFLGMAQVTASGDVNVTRLGDRLTGPGGFIDISQCTKRVNLLGSFTTGGLQVEIHDGELQIVQEGSIKKFVTSVPEVTFSGSQALRRGQIVRYITERCVFELTAEGLELLEVAPGVELQRDILDQMDFAPIVRNVRPMDAAIFRPERMRLLERHFKLDLADRMHYSEHNNTMYIDLQNVSINSMQDLDRMAAQVEGEFQKLGRKVHCIVNYSGFDCRSELQAPYEAVLARLQARHYLSIKRFSGRAFTRHKIGHSIGLREGELFTLEELQRIVSQRRGLTVNPGDVESLFRRHKNDVGLLPRDRLKLILELLV